MGIEDINGFVCVWSAVKEVVVGRECRGVLWDHYGAYHDRCVRVVVEFNRNDSKISIALEGEKRFLVIVIIKRELPRSYMLKLCRNHYRRKFQG